MVFQKKVLSSSSISHNLDRQPAEVKNQGKQKNTPPAALGEQARYKKGEDLKKFIYHSLLPYI